MNYQCYDEIVTDPVGITADSAQQAANIYVYDYLQDDIYQTAVAYICVDGDWVRGVAEAQVPDCINDQQHNWDDASVHDSNHGGCVTAEICTHCGCEQITDTGATDETGKPFTCVTYRI